MSLVGADDYQAMRETIAVLSDSELMNAVREGLAQLHTGDFLDEDQLADYIQRGRGSR